MSNRRAFLAALVGGAVAAVTRALPVSAAAPTDFPDGITLGPSGAPDLRLWRHHARVAQIDDGAGGQAHLFVTGSSYAGLGLFRNGAEHAFKVDHASGQTTAGYLLAGYRDETHVRLLVDGATVNFQGPTSRAEDEPIHGQALFLFQPSYWDAAEGKSKDANLNITARAEPDGKGILMFEVPGREVMTIRLEGLEIHANTWPNEPPARLSGGNDGRLGFGDDTGVQRVGPATLGIIGEALRLPASTLPEPSEALRGEVRWVEGESGKADALYVCGRAANGGFTWRKVV